MLRVGCVDDYLPYCDVDEEGQATGLMTDVLDGIFEAVDTDQVPDIQYRVYGSYKELVDAVRSGEVDLAFFTREGSKLAYLSDLCYY